MKTIRMYFKTLTQAERYQTMLYNTYDHVELVSSPTFSENGFYVWSVK